MLTIELVYDAYIQAVTLFASLSALYVTAI